LLHSRNCSTNKTNKQIKQTQILPDDGCIGRLGINCKSSIRNIVAKYNDLKEMPSPAANPAGAQKSDFRMGKFLFEDETKTEGTIEILRSFLKELSMENEVVLTHGDQLTVARVLSAQDCLVNEDSQKEKLAGFLPVPGGFHFRWKEMRVIFEAFWGKETQVGTLSHARVFLQRKQRIDRQVKHFNHGHELLVDVIDAQILAILWGILGSRKSVEEKDLDSVVSRPKCFKKQNKTKQNKKNNQILDNK